jgi:hypothetical protein
VFNPDELGAIIPPKKKSNFISILKKTTGKRERGSTRPSRYPSLLNFISPNLRGLDETLHKHPSYLFTIAQPGIIIVYS